jgi:hypothetical protein
LNSSEFCQNVWHPGALVHLRARIPDTDKWQAAAQTGSKQMIGERCPIMPRSPPSGAWRITKKDMCSVLLNAQGTRWPMRWAKGMLDIW